MTTRFSRLIEPLMGLRHNPLLRRLAVYGSSSGLSQAVMMVYGILVARHLGPQGYGLFASNYALAGISIFLVNWGMDTWMLREGGAHKEPRALSGVVLQTKLITGLAWVLVLVLVAPLIRPELFPRGLLLVAALDLLFDSLAGTLVSGLNIAGRTGQAAQVQLFTRLGRLVGALVLVFGVISFDPGRFALLRLAATLLGLCLGYGVLRPIWDSLDGGAALRTLRASFPYSLPELLALIYAQVDVTLLGLLATVQQVGEYSPAVSLINALTVVPVSIFYILVPILTNTFVQNRAQFARAVRQMGLIYLSIGLVLTTLTALVFAPLLTLFLAERYTMSGGLVLLMSPIVLLKSLSFSGATYLVVVGQQARRIGVQLVSALLNIALNLLVIPRFGPTGAAWIYIFSELVLAIGYLLLAARHYRAQTA